MGEAENGRLGLAFDGHLRLEFRGAKVTSDAGLLAIRELDGALGLTAMAGGIIKEGRTGKNIRHEMEGLLQQLGYAGWPLRSVQLKLIKIGARIVSHSRRTVFQMAEVAITGELFAEVLARIRSLAAVFA